MDKLTPEQEAEKMYPDADVQKIKKEFPEERDHVRIINTINYEAGIRRSAHITAARMYMGEISTLKAENEKLMNPWVPVEHGLPPKFKNVLGYSKLGHIRITCVDGAGKLDEYELEVDNDDYYTHWCYFPATEALKTNTQEIKEDKTQQP